MLHPKVTSAAPCSCAHCRVKFIHVGILYSSLKSVPQTMSVYMYTVVWYSNDSVALVSPVAATLQAMTSAPAQVVLQRTVVSCYTEPLLYRTSGHTERFYLVTELIFVTKSYSLYQTSGYSEQSSRARVRYSERQME